MTDPTTTASTPGAPPKETAVPDQTPPMSDHTALAALLHAEGAYCGACDFEGRCSDCDRILDTYAGAILRAGWRPPARVITDVAELDELVESRAVAARLVAEALRLRARVTELEAQRAAALGHTIPRGGGEFTHDHNILEGHDGCPACWAEDIRKALGGQANA